MSAELGERREERSLPNHPPAVIPNAERDLNAMAMERQGKEVKRREISPDGRDDNGGRSSRIAPLLSSRTQRGISMQWR